MLKLSISILCVVVFVGMVCVGIILETAEFNDGICPRCDKKLRHFGNTSQGNRGYICDKCGYAAWVSYNCVDKKYRKEYENDTK